MIALSRPLRRVVTTHLRPPYRDRLVVTLDGPTLILRERGRRKASEVRLDLGALYVMALERQARARRIRR